MDAAQDTLATALKLCEINLMQFGGQRIPLPLK